VPAKRGWIAPAESDSSQGFFLCHYADYVPHCCLREFFLATVAFWLAHWGIKAQHVKNNVFNKMIEIYFVSVAISFILMSLIFYFY